MLKITLLFSVFMAVLVLSTQKLRQSVIYLAVFSIAISFVYALYHAPDVAMAEAIIGSAISTILYVVTLQKYQLFTVYVPISGVPADDELMTMGDQSPLIKSIGIFCIKESLEAQVIYTTETIERIKELHDYAIILHSEGNRSYRLFAHPDNYKEEMLEAYLSQKMSADYSLNFQKVAEEAVYE